MSNFDTLIDAAKDKSEEELAGWLQVLGVSPNRSPHDAPDQYGAVAIHAIRATRPEAKDRWITREIADSLPPGPAKDFANHQIWIANGWYMFAKMMIHAASDENNNAIPNVMVAADTDPRTFIPVLPTIQSLTDWLNSQPDPSAGAGGFGPAQK
jgi:hypothetical protein